MDLRKKIFNKYDDFVLVEQKADKDLLRSEIKLLLKGFSNKDSNCYYLLGLVDFESDDWEMHIDNVVANFKKAIELDKENVLTQLYLAHCYHDQNKLKLAL